jgi:2'-5' RNA ligase
VDSIGEAATVAASPMHVPGVAKTLTRAASAPARPPAGRTKLAPEGLVTAIVAVTGVVDLVEDIIVPGAFAASLKKIRPKVVHHHDWKLDTGRVLHVEELLPGDRRLPKRTPNGQPWPKEAGALLATMQFNLAVQRGREAWEMCRFYAESGEAAFSIGYKVLPGLATKRGGIRYIYGLDLWELSCVLHGAHPLTMALEVKGAYDGDELERKEAPGSVLGETGEQPDFSDGVMVALYPPAAVQRELAVPGGSPADDLHITLAYLGDGSSWSTEATEKVADALADVVSRSGALAGSVGGLGQFPAGPDGAPTFVPVDVPGLVELRQAIVDTLAAVGHPQVSEHGFTPHLTLGYGLSDVAPVESTPVTFDDAVLVVGDVRRQLPLTPPAAEPVEAVEPPRAPLEAKSAQAVLAAAKPPEPERAGWGWKSAGDVALAARFGDPFGLLEQKSGVPGVADTPQDHQSVARLRRAWTHGSVAAQIGWGTDGDFTRCTAIAEKYMSPEHAKGWCNLRHHDATGMYPATHAKLDRLEKKAAAPEDMETKMAQMAGSMEERLSAVSAAVREALGGGDGCWVSIDATYPDHVIATRMEGEGAGESFSVAYSMAGDTVSVGEPKPVTLSVIASPAGEGTGEELSLAAAAEARFLTPAVEQLGELSSLVTAAPMEGKAMRTLRPAVQDFLDALAVKGMNVPGLLLGDDEDDEDDPEDGDKPDGGKKPWEKKGDPSEDDLEDDLDDDPDLDEDDSMPAGGTEDAITDGATDDEEDDEDLEEKGVVHLDITSVVADLAALRGEA